MGEKFNSFAALGALRDSLLELKPDTKNEEMEESQEREFPKHSDTKEINDNIVENTTTEPLTVGQVISGIDKDGSIASWHSHKDGFFARVSSEYSRAGDWKAVSNPGYVGKGLVVFLNKKPEKGDSIRITKVSEKFATGVVVS